MDQHEAILARHSVRSFTDEPLGAADRQHLEAMIGQCNAESGLEITLVCDEAEAFDSTMAHYGKFTGVRNYIVLAGKPGPDLEERCGYYGERIVLEAQMLGLNTCWVAMTVNRRHVKRLIPSDAKLVVVIALGHGVTQGAARKSKSFDQVSSAPTDVPTWYTRGVEAALLAPTSTNQQNFMFTLLEDEVDGLRKVSLVSKGGFFSKVDLGIVRCHFEIGAGSENFVWER